MSGLILSGGPVPTAVRPNRKARLAQRALAGQPVPNMQPRQRGLPPVTGCGVAMSPIGPALVFQLGDGQGLPLPLTPEQGRQIGVGLISIAAHYELLKKMQSDQAELESDGEPVAVSPEAEALLAEAIGAAGGPVGLKGDEVETDDELDLAAGPETIHDFPVVFADGSDGPGSTDVSPAPNAFDINGRPCYMPPTGDDEAA